MYLSSEKKVVLFWLTLILSKHSLSYFHGDVSERLLRTPTQFTGDKHVCIFCATFSLVMTRYLSIFTLIAHPVCANVD